MKFTKKGFTLIELLIVIAIIGILAVAFLPSLLDAPSRGRDAQRLATMQKIQNFLVTELLAGNDLPPSGCLEDADAAGTDPATISSSVNGALADFGGVYPTDPSASNEATDAAGLNCNGYGFVNFDDDADPAVPYTAGLFVRVENEENANIACASIEEGAAPALIDSDDLAADDIPCYLSLIQ